MFKFEWGVLTETDVTTAYIYIYIYTHTHTHTHTQTHTNLPTQTYVYELKPLTSVRQQAEQNKQKPEGRNMLHLT